MKVTTIENVELKYKINQCPKIVKDYINVLENRMLAKQDLIEKATSEIKRISAELKNSKNEGFADGYKQATDDIFSSI
jgi:hypothetical protein